MEIQDDDFILTLSLILNLPFFLDENYRSKNQVPLGSRFYECIFTTFKLTLKVPWVLRFTYHQ